MINNPTPEQMRKALEKENAHAIEMTPEKRIMFKNVSAQIIEAMMSSHATMFEALAILEFVRNAIQEAAGMESVSILSFTDKSPKGQA